MSTVAEPLGLVAKPPVQVAATPRSPWLVGPAFDLLFLANWGWPILVLLAVLTAQATPEGNFDTHPSLVFWQLYFLSTPHRWITLALVFFDGERFWQRPSAYVGIALTFLLVIAAVCLSTQTLILLIMIDYVWNAWHFASQHSGISRIYGRTARPDVQTNGMFEKVVLRVFILYAIFRLLGYPTGVPGEDASAWPDSVKGVVGSFQYLHRGVVETIQGLDLVMLALPALLIGLELRDFRRSAIGRLAYLGSVCLLYSLMLLSVHFEVDIRIRLGLFMSVSMFHAIEYLAIVSWSVWKKHGRTPGTLFGHLVPRWGVAIVTFMTVFALTGWIMSNASPFLRLPEHYLRGWLIVTIFVSYLHYAYDGMIWKVRRPASAAVS